MRAVFEGADMDRFFSGDVLLGDDVTRLEEKKCLKHSNRVGVAAFRFTLRSSRSS